MPRFTNSQSALKRAGEISDELASLYGELAMVKSQSLSAGVDAFTQSVASQENVTTAREHARAAAAPADRMALRTQGEIDALLIEWRYIDLWLTQTTVPNGRH